MIDSHCHLDSFENIEEIISKAKSKNVEKILTIATDIDNFEKNFLIAKNNDDVFLSIGIHPEYADKNVDFDENIINCYAMNKNTVGIGEIGLDYHYDSSLKHNQITIFKRQLDLASKLNLPVIIHSRDADDDMIKILSEYKGKVTGVLHCFSSSFELARFALEIGFYISASGIITFKNSFSLRDIFKTIPLNRLLIETDAPYLAPHPMRGKQNEPSLISYTLECLAALKEVSFMEMDKITTENFYNLFKKAQDA